MLLINILNIIFIILIILHFISNRKFIENYEGNKQDQINNLWKKIYKKYLFLEEDMKYFISDENKQRFENAKNKDVNNASDTTNNDVKIATSNSVHKKKK